MEKGTFTVTLADGTSITGLELNGNNFVSKTEVTPEMFAGKLCFNLELFPGALFGKPWILDGQSGLFPRQPNGPVRARSSNFSRSGHQR